jgi:hypothetical protein
VQNFFFGKWRSGNFDWKFQSLSLRWNWTANFFATFCLAKKFGEIDPWWFEKYGNINHQTSSKATYLTTFQEVG